VQEQPALSLDVGKIQQTPHPTVVAPTREVLVLTTLQKLGDLPDAVSLQQPPPRQLTDKRPPPTTDRQSQDSSAMGDDGSVPRGPPRGLPQLTAGMKPASVGRRVQEFGLAADVRMPLSPSRFTHSPSLGLSSSIAFKPSRRSQSSDAMVRAGRRSQSPDLVSRASRKAMALDLVDAFTVPDSSPRTAHTSERIPFDANRVTMLQDRTQHLKLWVKSFTHRWLNEIHEALSIFETSDFTHGVQYKRLHEASKEFFAAYREFRDTNMLSPGDLWEARIFDFDLSTWVLDIRSPRGSGKSDEMKAIRERCTSLIGELASARANIRFLISLEQNTAGGGTDGLDDKEPSTLPPVIDRRLEPGAERRMEDGN